MAKDKKQETQETPKGELVPYDSQSKGLVVKSEQAALTIFHTTYDVNNIDSRMELLDIVNNKTANASEWTNKEFGIAHITIFPKQYLPTKEGEIIEAIWSCITTDKGEFITFHSHGILDTLRNIIALGGEPPYIHLGKWLLTQSKVGSGFSMFSLRRVRS